MAKPLLFHKHILAFLSLIAVVNTLHAQVYLSESFDNAFTGSPAAPAGWSQLRTNLYSDGMPVGNNQSGPKDWSRNINTAGSWSQSSFGTVPAAPKAGTGALWIEDSDFGSLSNTMERFMATPAVNLASSTTPYVSFFLFCDLPSNSQYPVKVLASTDNGVSWKLIKLVQPGFTTSSTASSNTPWQSINVRIPAAYRIANAKFALGWANQWNGFHDVYIDSFTIREYTPTTITSAASGLWSNPATWVGGVVPASDNNVVIDIGHTVSIDVGIARAQNVSVSGTLTHNSASSSQVLQAFENLTINSGGTYTGGNGSTGKYTYVGGNLSNAGTLTINQNTNATLLFSGGAAATISNTGTITGGYVSQVIHANSGGITYLSPFTIRNTSVLAEGAVDPNGNLVLGLSGVSHTITKHSRGYFTARPSMPSLGTAARSVIYGGGTNGTLPYAVHTQDTIFTGFETDTVAGTRIILGNVTFSSQNHIRLDGPLQVGNASIGGTVSFNQGIVFTSMANLLSVGPLGTGSGAASPSLSNPPASQGSFVNGPIRFLLPASGTAAIQAPLGAGGSYNRATVNSNVAKTLVLTPGAAWNAQVLTFSMAGAASGNAPPPVTSLIGDKTYKIDLNGGADLPAGSRLQFSAMNYTYGNSDRLFGTQDQLYILQSPSPAGPWTTRSGSSGSGAFADNTNYLYATATAAPGPVDPLSGKGSYFTFGTTADKMMIDGNPLKRNTQTISPGTSNNVMMRVNLHVSGVVPANLTQFNLSTAGTTRTAAIAAARIYFTGTDSSFAPTSSFGNNISSPAGPFNITGSRELAAGDNYFWIVYDVAAGALLHDSLAVQCMSVVFGGNTVLTAPPPAGYREVNVPMSFVSANAVQSNLSGVGRGTGGNNILDIEVMMSGTGAPVPATAFAFTTNGSASPATNISAATLYFTGSSAIFSRSQPVGSFTGPNGAFTISSNINLVNGSNHFWLTYDVPSSAVNGDSIDASLAAITINGTLQNTVIAPAGARRIRDPYCTSMANDPADEDIWAVSLGTLNSTSGCYTTGGNGSILNRYSDYTSGLAAPMLVTGVSYPLSIITGSCGGAYTSSLAVYADYNQDGDFVDAGELVFAPPAFVGDANGVTTSGVITVPCSALNGITRMRVVYVEQSSTPASCGNYSWGETEDYHINIGSPAAQYVASAAVQVQASAAAGSNNIAVLKVPVKVIASSCMASLITDMAFRTAGTTSTADILNAKLYATGNSAVFSNAKLLGSIAAPNGAMLFHFSDTALFDTNYFWLTYDIAPGAANGHALDAVLDSSKVFGTWQMPLVSNPAGSVLITSPMSYVSSGTIQPDLSKAPRGTANNGIAAVAVVMSAGAPVMLTQLNLNASGTTDTSNIYNIRVWYTGHSKTLATGTQFGNTLSNLPGSLSYTINGAQALLPDTNYFWITYDISANALPGNVLDAGCTGITLAATNYVPGITAPAGNRPIRVDYCTPVYSFGSFSCTDNAYITRVSTSGAQVDISNTSGCANNGTQYVVYSTPSLTIAQNSSFSINVQDPMGWNAYAAWIDYDQDGVFSASEMVFASNSYTQSATGNITVPCSALAGVTRMRVRSSTWSYPTDACTDFLDGEAEDYMVTIVACPIHYATATAVQQTGVVAPGTLGRPVLQVPVRIEGCGVGIANTFAFSTAGSTNVSDIAAARLYATGASSTFSTAKLLGTVNAPNGQFTFSVNDTLVNNVNNYYWLAYDVNPSAAVGRSLDATFDSISVLGAFHAPVMANPAGNLSIATGMSFVSATATQNNLSKVSKGSAHNEVIGIRVIMSHTGAPVSLTQLNLSAAGTTDTSGIRNLAVWYTGPSPAFAATTAFGNTMAALPGSMNFSVSGSQALGNDTNYFWLSYDIASNAAAGNSIDGVCNSIVIAGITQIPVSSAPAGSRQIREAYCFSGATSDADEEIIGVSIGSFSNASDCSSTGSAGTSLVPIASVPRMYSNYTNLEPINLTKGFNIPYTITTGTCGGNYGEQFAIYVDLNQDGDFADAGETAYTSPFFTGTASMPNSGSFTVPCTATAGISVLRIVYAENTAPVSCGTYDWGETEDYAVNILENPAAFGSSTAMQVTGSVGPGVIDQPVLRIPVYTTGCDAVVARSFSFRTTGTSNNADIVNAKLYKTGATPGFSNATLLATLASPSGAFTFAVNDTLVSNDTSNYWLTYDVNAAATPGNVLDAVLDSMYIFNAKRVPTTGNPVGNVLIEVPMTFVSAAAAQPNTSKVETGSADNAIVRIDVVMSNTGSPVKVNAINLGTNGSASPATNIAAAKVYYTGASNTFSTGTAFGSVSVAPSGGFMVTGNQALNNGANYFWLAYDIAAGANIGDSVDAVLSGITVNNIARTPTLSAPAGSRIIRGPYCGSGALSSGDEEIFGVSFGSLNNSSICNTTAPGAGSQPSLYSNYTGLPAAQVQQGAVIPFTVNAGSCGGSYNSTLGIFIDLNGDGDLTPDELVYASAPAPAAVGGSNISGAIVMPLNARPGETRLRVVYMEGNVTPTPCGSYSNGETEDYTIVITAASNNTYVWSGGTNGAFGTAANWTPARSNSNINDKLVFSSGGVVTISNVPSQQLRMLSVSNNTRVYLSTTGNNELIVSDSLELNNGTVRTNQAVLTLGTDTVYTGTLTATAGSGVYGSLRQWMNAAKTTLTYPLIDSNGTNRSVTIAYTSNPLISGALTVAFINALPGNDGLPLTDAVAGVNVNRAGVNGYWSLLPAATLSGGSYTGTFRATGFNGVSNYQKLVLMRRSGPGLSWSLNGTHAATTGSNAAPVLSRTSIAQYGEFGVGSDTAINKLPVELLSFSGQRRQQDVLLHWNTASELSNAGFWIERSADGKDFGAIHFTAGQGSTGLQSQYSYADEQAFLHATTGVLYYRLRQVDHDGAAAYSKTIAVYNTIAHTPVEVMPNPFSTQVNIKINLEADGEVMLTLTDMQGHVVWARRATGVKGENSITVDDCAALSEGVYFLRTAVAGESIVSRIVKTR